MAYNRAGVQEFIAKKGMTGNGDVDIWLNGRYEAAEIYIQNSGASTATLDVVMIPPVIEDISFTAAEQDLPSAYTPGTIAAGAENVLFLQTPLSGVRVKVSSNNGNINIVVRLVGRP